VINLLPPDAKRSITYARRNIMLSRWIGLVVASFAGVSLVVAFGLLYMTQSIKVNERQIADTRNQLKVQKLEETQKRVEDISSSLKLVIQVLSKEVLFSKLLKQIGAAMPPNTVLTGLSINKLQGGIDLQAAAVSYQSATQIQLNLQDPQNKIFSKSDIVSIQCNSSGTGSPIAARYPCVVNIRAQFTQNTPFSLINNGAKP
jgi:Tfp pilus assembly protein PilN